MSKKLSDAAKHYFNDFDVLNEAHQEVLELFESAWKACIREVNGQEGGDELKPRDYDGRRVWGQRNKNQTSGWQGNMYLYCRPALYAVAVDPTWDGCERGCFVVGVEATRGWIAQMMKSGDGAGKNAADEVARSRGISINWDNNKWFIKAPAIEINRDNPEETGRQIASRLYEMLAHIDALHQAADSIGAPLPTDSGLPPEVSDRI